MKSDRKNAGDCIRVSEAASFFATLFPVPKAAAAGYCRRLSALLASGSPLLEALPDSAKDGPRRILRVAGRLKAHVLAGELLSRAFAAERFPRSAAFFLLLAERTGSYPPCLALAAETLETELRLREDERGVLLYPILLCAGILAVFLLFSAFVFPAFETTLRALGIGLPPLTAALTHAGRWLLKNLIPIALSLAAGILLVLLMRRVPAVRLQTDALRLNTRAEKYRNAVLFCRAAALLDAGGATLPEALTGAADLLPNARAAIGIRRAVRRFEAGSALCEAIRQENIFPSFVLALLAAGERSDRIGPLLRSALPMLESERRAALKVRANVLRTLLLCLAATEIVLLFAALYAPLLAIFASLA